MLINGLGPLATGAITCALIVAQFTQGGWITVVAIPGLVLLMRSVHRHYEMMERDAHYHGEAKFGIHLKLGDFATAIITGGDDERFGKIPRNSYGVNLWQIAIPAKQFLPTSGIQA